MSGTLDVKYSSPDEVVLSKRDPHCNKIMLLQKSLNVGQLNR